jgi:RTX calcium-binding nonapeptide repeat (4 copies)
VRVRGFAPTVALAVALGGVPPAAADDLPVPVPGPTGPLPAPSVSAPQIPVPAPSFSPSLRLAPPPSDCTIEGDDGPNRLTGTSGPDVICGEGGDDVLEGLEGDDYLDGGDGLDTATWETSLCCVRADLSTGLASGSLGTDQLEEIENITGSQGTDVIRGDAGPNVLFGGGNTDLLFGGEGDDWLVGGDGDDWLAGEVGSNILDGGTGSNVCADGPGTFCEPPDPGDPSDTRGPLDVSLVDTGGTQNPPTWRIDVRGRLRAMRLWDEGYLVVSLDTQGGEEFDAHAVVRWDRRRPIGLLIADGARSSSGKVHVGRAGRRGVTVTVPLGQAGLDPQRLYYRWSAGSIFTGPGCRPCFDPVPQVRAYPQPLVTA